MTFLRTRLSAQKKENKVNVMVLLMIFAFLVCWLPYALVAMLLVMLQFPVHRFDRKGIFCILRSDVWCEDAPHHHLLPGPLLQEFSMLEPSNLLRIELSGKQKRYTVYHGTALK